MMKTKPSLYHCSALAAVVLLSLTACQQGCATPSSATMRFARTPSQVEEISHAVVALVRPTLRAHPGTISADPQSTGDTYADDMEEEDLVILSYGIYCSGSLLTENLVLTAYHCIDDRHELGHRIQVGTYTQYRRSQGTFRGNEWRWHDIVAVDAHNDLAILRLSSGQGNAHRRGTLPLATSNPRTGEHAFTMGHPRGLGWTLTYGVVSQGSRMGDDSASSADPHATRYVQASAQAYYGNSGGPLLNSRNEIIGVISRGGPFHIVFSVHVSLIRLLACQVPDVDIPTVRACSLSHELSAPTSAPSLVPFRVITHQR